MNRLRDVNNLTELLDSLKKEDRPIFINLCTRCNNDNFLTNQVIRKIKKKYRQDLGYYKMLETTSKIIKDELMISKNPVLLLIKNGHIKAIFGGIVAQYKLEQALTKLSVNINTRQELT